MFGGHKKLYAEGAQTEGQVTYFGWDSPDCWHYHLKVRAKLPDGTSTEFKQGSIDKLDYGTTFEGDVIPVRYDPSDYSKITVDLPALKARHEQSEAGQKATLDAQFANMDSSGSPFPGGAAQMPGGDLRAQILAAAAGGGSSVVDLRSSQASAGQAADPVERLEKLAALKQQGLLSDEQFEAAKAKVLGDGGG